MSIKKTCLLFFVLYSTQTWTTEAFLLDRILAVVNNQVISLSDVECELIFFNGNEHPIETEPEQLFSESAIEQGLQKLINQKLLLAEAKRFDLEEPTEIEVQQKIKKIKGKFKSPQAFEMALRITAITLEDLEEKAKKDLMADQFIDQRIRFFVIILPDEIFNYYNENKEKFNNKPYDKVEKDIEQILTRQKEKRKLEEYVSRLREKASIQRNFD